MDSISEGFLQNRLLYNDLPNCYLTNPEREFSFRNIFMKTLIKIGKIVGHKGNANM